nr:hypothetical protein [uncultured Allomuricauda sp.]
MKRVKNNFKFKYSIGYVFLLLSIFLPLVAYFQDMEGESMVSSDFLILLGFSLLLTAIVLGILNRNNLLFSASVVLIGIAVWSHVSFRTSSIRTQEMGFTHTDPKRTGNSEFECIVNIEDPIPPGKAQFPYNGETWRNALYSFSVLKVQDDQFTFRIKAYGSTYYLFFVSFDEVEVEAQGFLYCRRTQDHCEIVLREKEGSTWEKSEGLVSVALQAIEKYGSNGNFVTITFNSGAALNNSGTVGAGIGPASLALNFPSSKLEGKITNGTGLWSCISE